MIAGRMALALLLAAQVSFAGTAAEPDPRLAFGDQLMLEKRYREAELEYERWAVDSPNAAARRSALEKMFNAALENDAPALGLTIARAWEDRSPETCLPAFYASRFLYQMGNDAAVEGRSLKGVCEPDLQSAHHYLRGLSALRLQQCAAVTGFEWTDPQPVLDKLLEEIEEVRAEFVAGADPARLEDEIGDVLFVMVNLARRAGVDFPRALRHANAKFERRFRRMEQLAADDGVEFATCSLAEQEQLWQRAKSAERRP